MVKADTAERFLTAPLLAEVDPDSRRTVLDALEEDRASSGAIVLKQGSPNNRLGFVVEGAVVIERLVPWGPAGSPDDPDRPDRLRDDLVFPAQPVDHLGPCHDRHPDVDTGPPRARATPPCEPPRLRGAGPGGRPRSLRAVRPARPAGFRPDGPACRRSAQGHRVVELPRPAVRRAEHLTRPGPSTLGLVSSEGSHVAHALQGSRRAWAASVNRDASTKRPEYPDSSRIYKTLREG